MPTKEEIDRWLESKNKDRKWLASLCDVKPQQVYNWFSKSGKIPQGKLNLIGKLMQESHDEREMPEELPNIEELGKIFLTLEPEIQRIVEKEAHRLGVTINAYCSLAVEYCAAEPEMNKELYALFLAKKTPVKSSSNDSYPRRLSSAG